MQFESRRVIYVKLMKKKAPTQYMRQLRVRHHIINTVFVYLDASNFSNGSTSYILTNVSATVPTSLFCPIIGLFHIPRKFFLCLRGLGKMRLFQLAFLYLYCDVISLMIINLLYCSCLYYMLCLNITTYDGILFPLFILLLLSIMNSVEKCTKCNVC